MQGNPLEPIFLFKKSHGIWKLNFHAKNVDVQLFTEVCMYVFNALFCSFTLFNCSGKTHSVNWVKTHLRKFKKKTALSHDITFGLRSFSSTQNDINLRLSLSWPVVQWWNNLSSLLYNFSVRIPLIPLIIILSCNFSLKYFFLRNLDFLRKN